MYIYIYIYFHFYSPIRLCLGVPTYFVQRIGELEAASSSEPGFPGAGSSELGFPGAGSSELGFPGAGSSELGFLGGSLGARVPWRVHRSSGSLAGLLELGTVT